MSVRVLYGVPELSEHVFFHNYEYCAETTEDVDTKNFLKYSSKGKAKCHTPPKSPHDPVQSLFPVSAEDLFFPLCSSTKQAIIDKGHIPRFHNCYLCAKI